MTVLNEVLKFSTNEVLKSAMWTRWVNIEKFRLMTFTYIMCLMF